MLGLGTKPRPMIGKLSELLVSGTRAAFSDVGTSPRGLKNYDLGGVGLGIVAALENSGDAKFTLCCSSLINRTSPRPVNPAAGKHSTRFGGDEVDDSEDYTYVTCHVPNKRITKVYYDRGYQEEGFERFNELGLSKNSETRTRSSSSSSFSEYPDSGFLSSCHLCRKELHGKDIYMYRGEKGFCSVECRSSHMMNEERKEQCRSDAPRSADISSSPYTRGQIFSTGILAV